MDTMSTWLKSSCTCFNPVSTHWAKLTFCSNLFPPREAFSFFEANEVSSYIIIMLRAHCRMVVNPRTERKTCCHSYKYAPNTSQGPGASAQYV